MEIQWRIRLAEHSTQKRVVLWLAVVGVVLFGLALRMPLLGFMGAGFLSPILYEYHYGRKFVVNEEGVVAGLNNLNWSSIKSVRRVENAVQLSPFEDESRLDATRGVTLIFDDSVDREAVEQLIRENVNKDVRFLG